MSYFASGSAVESYNSSQNFNMQLNSSLGHIFKNELVSLGSLSLLFFLFGRQLCIMVLGVLSVTDPLRRAEYCLLFRKLGRENGHICLYAPLTDRHTHEPFVVSPH